MKQNIEEEISVLKENPFVNKEVLHEIEEAWRKKNISDEECLKNLKELSRRPLGNISLSKFDNDWIALTKVINESEERIKKETKNQLYIGLYCIPVFLTFLFVSIFLGWYNKSISTTFLPILLAIIASIITYTFFILRTYQQASIAIERLVEKRVGVLFLRIASTLDKDTFRADAFIKAGTEMFLGHHAPATNPLSPEDLASSKDKEKAK